MSEETILVKLDYITKKIDKIEGFVDNIDLYFDRKYEEKKLSCPGYAWCKEGIGEFDDMAKDFSLHLQEHKILAAQNEKAANNKKYIIGLFFSQFIALIVYLWHKLSSIK